jgi:DNA-binding HxlR family transcriptional regulator
MPASASDKRAKRRRAGARRSLCPLATALDLVGDKWSLVLVRDMMMRKGKYQEFLRSPERIPTNILADRLKILEGLGVVRRRRYQAHPVRYEYILTRKGAELLPVLQQLVLWARKYVPGCWAPPKGFFEATPDDLVAARPKAPERKA